MKNSEEREERKSERKGASENIYIIKVFRKESRGKRGDLGW